MANIVPTIEIYSKESVDAENQLAANKIIPDSSFPTLILPTKIATNTADKYVAVFAEEYEKLQDLRSKLTARDANAKALYDSIIESKLPHTFLLKQHNIYTTFKNGITNAWYTYINKANMPDHEILSLPATLKLDYFRISIVILSVVVPLLAINVADNLTFFNTYFQSCKQFTVGSSITASDFDSGTDCSQNTFPFFIGSNEKNNGLPTVNDSNGQCKSITTTYYTNSWSGFSILQFLVYFLTMLYGLHLMIRENEEKVILSKCFSLGCIFLRKNKFSFNSTKSIFFDVFMIIALTVFYGFTLLMRSYWLIRVYFFPVNPSYNDQLIKDFTSSINCNKGACEGSSFFSQVMYREASCQNLNSGDAYIVDYYISLLSNPIVAIILIIFFFIKLVNLLLSQFNIFDWIKPERLLLNRFQMSSAYYNLVNFRDRCISEAMLNDITLVNIECLFWSVLMDNKGGSKYSDSVQKLSQIEVEAAEKTLSCIKDNHNKISSQIADLQAVYAKSEGHSATKKESANDAAAAFASTMLDITS